MSTSECYSAKEPALAELSAPVRNRYFFGKLLDAHHLELEQDYLNRKRWMLSRLGLGAGVLCGLQVRAIQRGTRLEIAPGVAIDGFGREIVVPEPSSPIDPSQPLDECGRPSGAPLRTGGTVTIWLCYHECDAEPSRVMVDECGPAEKCENGVTMERYHVMVTAGEPGLPGRLSPRECAAIFGEPPKRGTRRELICRLLSGPCPDVEQPCVPLAVARIDDSGRLLSVDNCGFRASLYSNAMLFDLILCLAERVDICCGGKALKALEIVSGNSQSGTPQQPLAEPLVVRVTEGGTPVANETVDFLAIEGRVGESGTLGASFQTQTDGSGLATCPVWELGPAEGVHRTRATISSGMPAMVEFQAAAKQPQLSFPTIESVWPPNATSLRRTSGGIESEWFQLWLRQPFIELTFDRKIWLEQLQNPTNWLRVFMVLSHGDNEIEVVPLPVLFDGVGTTPITGVAGVPARYTLPQAPRTTGRLVRFLVLVRPEPDLVLDADTRSLLLDGEFAGSVHEQVQLDEIWSLKVPHVFNDDVWNAFAAPTPAPVLPRSGDGAEGGQFHSWFELSPE